MSQNDGYGQVKLADARNTCGIIGLSWTYRYHRQTRENRILAVWAAGSTIIPEAFRFTGKDFATPISRPPGPAPKASALS